MEKPKVVYILPFFDEDTDTHLFYNYELIKEVSKVLDIFVIIERAVGNPNKLGCKYQVQKFKNPIFRFLELLFILKIMRLRGYKNFYTHYSYYGAFVSFFLTKIFGGNAFYWNRGMPWLFKRNWFEEKVLRFILKHTILATSPESLALEYQKIYGTKKYAILSNWIDIERYKPTMSKEEAKKSLGLDNAKKHVLFVHHLSKRKGADLIVPVAERFGEDVVFVVAGDGPHSVEGDNIILLGKIPQSEVVKYFHASDIFFMPSREEGSPHVLLEAMASGVSFVASDVGGVKELVGETLLDFLCKSEDVDCFTEKIKTLLSDNELYDKARAECLKRAENYDISLGVREFTNLFNNENNNISDKRS